MTPAEPTGQRDRAGELAEAETIVRSTEQEYQDAADAIVLVMAEYDRRGLVVAAARALVESRGMPGWGQGPDLDSRIAAIAHAVHKLDEDDR